MRLNGRSIYSCTMAEPEFVAPRGTRLTQSNDGKRLYIRILEYPYKFLEMRQLAGRIEYAQFLHDGSEILFHEGKVNHFSAGQTVGQDLVVFRLPEIKPDIIDPVIKVILK